MNSSKISKNLFPNIANKTERSQLNESVVDFDESVIVEYINRDIFNPGQLV